MLDRDVVYADRGSTRGRTTSLCWRPTATPATSRDMLLLSSQHTQDCYTENLSKVLLNPSADKLLTTPAGEKFLKSTVLSVNVYFLLTFRLDLPVTFWHSAQMKVISI